MEHHGERSLKLLSLYEIVHVSLFFLTGGAVTRIGIRLGLQYSDRFILSLIINDNIKSADISRKVCIPICLNRCTENQIFPRNSFFSNVDIQMFLYLLTECLHVNRMYISSF